MTQTYICAASRKGPCLYNWTKKAVIIWAKRCFWNGKQAMRKKNTIGYEKKFAIWIIGIIAWLAIFIFIKGIPVANDKNISHLCRLQFFAISRFAIVNKYRSGTLEQKQIMGTRVAYCVDMDKSVIIGNFEKRGWVAGWTIYLLFRSPDPTINSKTTNSHFHEFSGNFGFLVSELAVESGEQDDIYILFITCQQPILNSESNNFV